MNWHRLFGLVLTDFFTGTPYVVELEKDLSHQQQLLDVVILRKGKGRFTRRLPDGLDDLASHNLITFKSHHEALDDWALKELTGHYVNYRKQLSPQDEPLLPESAFRLYAVCSRFPHNLAQEVPWESVQEGVHRCRRGTDVIHVVVVGQLPRTEHNAPLHLFSASADRVGFGASHYQQRSQRTSTLLIKLFEGYQQEGVVMPYTMEDFERDFIEERLKKLTVKERLVGVTPEELLASMTPAEIDRLLQTLQTVRSSRSSKTRRKNKAGDSTKP